ncbi:MAG: CoA transferase [Dehalococcoidia bacterium]
MATSWIAGLQVIDLAGPAGWYGSKLLADLGADVVRIEPPGGDPMRNLGPFVHGQSGNGRSLTFAYFNTNKRSLTLDLEGTPGIDVFRRLASRADIVLETEAPGAMARRGIGFEELRHANPGLIWAAVTPFGQTGPRAHWKATDLVAMATGGVLYPSGFPDRPPNYSPLDQAYNLAGAAAVSGALIALQARATTGRGQFIDVSLQAAAATATESVLGFWDSMGTNWKRAGSIGWQGFDLLFPCLDGWVIGYLGQRWSALLAWGESVGVADELWRDPKWHDRDVRDANLGQITSFARQLFAVQSMAEIAQRAQQHRIPFQAVNRIPDLLADQQLAFRGYWTPVAHDDLGMILTYPGAPFFTSSGFWRIRRRAPTPGEHTAEVLTELDADATPKLTQPTSGTGGSSVVRPVLSPEQSDADDRWTAHPRLALRGIRIVDFTTAATGPLTTRILADHGAEVIKVEWSKRLDSPRNNIVPRTPGQTGPNASANWNALNSSKRSITVNLNTPGARALVREIISISDIVIDNYGTDPLPKWGFSYPDLRHLRPDLIMARSSVMGRSGPRNGHVGLGNGIAAAAAWNTMMGWPGDPPVGMGPAFPDFAVNCHHLLVAILTALEHRRRTGEGQYIDLSQHESTICWIGPAILDYVVNGQVQPPRQNRHPDFAPHGLYPAAGDDSWIAIAVDDTTWDAFVTVVGEALDQVSQFSTHTARKAREDELDRQVAAWTAGQDAAALTDRLQRAGVPAGIVAKGEDLLRDPQLAHRQHYLALHHPIVGVRHWERHAFLAAETPGWPSRSPLLGEDNDWMVGELLGRSEDEVAQAYVDGVID